MKSQCIYLEDKVSNCHSIIIHMKLSKYLDLVKQAYDQQGNLNGQRTALSSASARKIRAQMTRDFENGSVLPPVVVGLVESQFDVSKLESSPIFFDFIDGVKNKLCIIDGMQRTTAMINADVNKAERDIRVEFWITDSTSNLIYRMLVLNTGQVPWNTKRQLEVVLQPITSELRQKVRGIKLFDLNSSRRRTQPGEFQADKVIESFLVFGARSEKTNKRDIIADEYTKLEFIESSSKQKLLDIYAQFLSRLVKLDQQFARSSQPEKVDSYKFKKGLDLFSSQPFLIGVTVAFAIRILGRPKKDYSPEKQLANLDRVLNSFDRLLLDLQAKNPQELHDFLCLSELNEQLPTSTSSRIGDIEREFFKDAFNVLIDENFDIDNMDICWSH